MVSAPSGNGAPVKMRAASPLSTIPESGAGRDFGDDAQVGRHLFDIGGTHRIAVHRRHREGRLGAARRDIFGQHPADRVGDRHLFGRQGFQRRQQPRQGFFDRDHRVTLPRR
jgi:hypothetical protein